MGILDDAIRDHLDLKRRHGATEEELRRLEQEAFGPPARPGEEEFSVPDERGPQDAERAGAGLPEFADELDEEPTRIASAAELAEAPPAEAPAEERAADEPVVETEPAAEEEPAPAEGAAEAAGGALDTAEREAIAEQPTRVFHQEELEELGIEPEEEAEPAAEPAADEHEAQAADEEDVAEEEDEAAEGDEDEDVLEETPDFLRDAPEDDELWFEQGEPKDFDF
jgi:hypothetical protein